MVTKQDIEDAQASWGNGVIAVGSAPSPTEAHARAVQWVKAHYQVEDASLLFCPTRPATQQFRRTLEETVSYFVGQNLVHDGGFALEPWSSVRFDNAGIVCRGDVGIAMGKYFFGRSDGSELEAEYSLVYVFDNGGQLKIQLHHSALPYSA